MKFDIFKNDKKINSIVADKEFCERYCKANGYTYSETIEETASQGAEITFTREDEIDAMLIEQEYRLTLIELGLAELEVKNDVV